MPNLLKPGYIPEGWTPGDHIHIVEARPGRGKHRPKRGAAIYAPKGIEVALQVAGVTGAIAMIWWDWEDTHDVAMWLAWWNSFRGLVVLNPARPH